MASRSELLDYIKKNGPVSEFQIVQELGSRAGDALNKLKFQIDPKTGAFLLGLAIRSDTEPVVKKFTAYIKSKTGKYATKKEIEKFVETGEGGLIKQTGQITLYSDDDFAVYLTVEEDKLVSEGKIGGKNIQALVPENVGKVFPLIKGKSTR